MHDMRTSSPLLAEAFGRGVAGQGADVVAGGLGSTDMLYYASGSLGIPGAMITASHNPPKYNGIKLCRSGAKPVGEDTGLAELRDAAERGVPARQGPAGTIASHFGYPAAFWMAAIALSASAVAGWYVFRGQEEPAFAEVESLDGVDLVTEGIDVG